MNRRSQYGGARQEGDIDGFSGQTGVKRCAFQLGFTRVKSLLYLLSFAALMTAPAADALPAALNRWRGSSSEGLNAPFLAQIFDAYYICLRQRI